MKNLDEVQLRDAIRKEIISGKTNYHIEYWIESKMNDLLENKDFIRKLREKLRA